MLGLWNVGVVGSRLGKGCGPQSGMQEGLSGRFSLPPFGPSVLEPDLDPGFAEVQTQGQLLACEDVGVRCPLERFFQLLQLEPGECGPGLLLLASIALAVVAAAAAATAVLALRLLLTIISQIPGTRVLESCEAASVQRRGSGMQSRMGDKNKFLFYGFCL